MADDVLTPELVEEASLIPRVSEASLSRLDMAVHDIANQATTYKCESENDFAVGDTTVGRIRQLDKIFDGVYTPLKRFHDAMKAKVLDEEKRKRKPLEDAKKIIGARMIAWEAAENTKRAELVKKLQDAERKRAEDARLAQAIALTEHAKSTQQPELIDKAARMLDEPLDIAPVQISKTFDLPGRNTKSVNRLAVEVTDLKALLMCIGATLIAQDPSSQDAGGGFRARLQPYRNKIVEGILDSEDNRERIAAALTTWARTEARSRGEAFIVPGISAGKKPGLG